MTESAKEAMTCLIFSYLYLFYCSRFFSSSSWILAYSCWALMSWGKIKNYFESLSFGLLFEPSFILFVFLQNSLEPIEFFLFAFSHFSFFKRDFFLDFRDQEFIKLIFLFLLNFLSLVFVLDLSVSHFLFEFDFSLVLFLFLSFSLIIEFGLLLLEFEILLTLFFLVLFLSAFFFHLLIELFFDFFLELFFSHFLEFFFLLEKFCIKLDESSPFVIIVTLNLVNWFWSNRACLRASFWTGNLAFGLLFLLSLWWYLASFLDGISLIDLLSLDLAFSFFWGRLFWIKNKCYSFGFAFCTHQLLWRHLAWGLWGIIQ